MFTENEFGNSWKNQLEYLNCDVMEKRSIDETVHQICIYSQKLADDDLDNIFSIIVENIYRDIKNCQPEMIAVVQN